MKMTGMAIAIAVLFVSCSRPEPQGAPETQSGRAEGTAIEMTAEAQKHVGMQVLPASSEELTEYLQVTGTVQAIDSRIGEVRPLARGRIQQVLAKVGDRVRKGQPLLRFDNVEAGELVSQNSAARAELNRLKVQQATARRQAERNRGLAEIGAVAQKEVELSEAEENGLLESLKAQESIISGIAARLRRFGMRIDERGATGSSADSMTAIESPFSGVVISSDAAPGEVIDTEKQLFAIADLSRIWVQAEVYEKDIGRVRVGQTAFISVDTYPGEQFSGRVSYVSDVLDPKTRTARVRCEVANLDLRLKLDMFATVAVPTTFSKQVTAVPAGALQQIDARNVVFVRKSASQFEPRRVKVGKTVKGKTEIIEGLSPGEPVVAQGAFHLKSILLGKELAEKE